MATLRQAQDTYTVDRMLTEAIDPYCLDRDAAAQMLADAPWRRFAVIGDSLAAGTGDPSAGYDTTGWSVRVVDRLRKVQPDLAVLDVAKVGATISRVIDRQLDAVTAFEPDLILVSCGANDIWLDEPDFDTIETNLRSLVSSLGMTRAQLVTFTYGSAFVVPTYPDWGTRVQRLNRLIRGIAGEFGVGVIDFWDHPVNRRADLLSTDGIHWSAMGQAVIAAETVKLLAGLTRSTAAKLR